MAINFFNNLQVNKGYIEIDDGGTTNQRGIISYGVNGKIGATTGWTPDTGGNPGLWVEGSNDGESGGIFMNGNTCALWSPGDQGILKIYDEDNFSQGAVYQITGSGISEGNRFASIFDTAYYLDPDGDSQLNTVDIDDYVRHRGDTNTYIGFPANDNFIVTTANVERFRVGSAGQLGIGGTNYGTSGQVLTSNGSGAPPSWQTPTVGDITAVNAGDYLSGGGSSGSVTLNLDVGTSGDWWGKGVAVRSDGVMEVGKYIDFHDADAGTSDYDFRITSASGRLYFSGDLEVDGGDIYINDSNTRITEGSADSVRLQTSTGYVDVGSMNASYTHLQTDRPAFYFDKRIEIGDNQIRSYNGDFNINRAGSATHRLRITSGTTISDQPFQVIDYNSLFLNGVELKGYPSSDLWFISNASSASFNVGTNWDWDKQIALDYSPGTTGAAAGVLEIGQVQKNNTNFTHGETRLKVAGVNRMIINTSGVRINDPGNTVNGTYALAVNQNTTASSLDAFACGENTTASGRQAFAGGYNTTASGAGSFAIGGNSVASGANSLCAGGDGTTTGATATSIGTLNDATGDYSFAAGYNSTASGLVSFAMGSGSTASGSKATAFGEGNNIAGELDFAVGAFNSSVASRSYGNIIAGYDNDITSYSTSAASSLNLLTGTQNVIGNSALSSSSGDFNIVGGANNKVGFGVISTTNVSSSSNKNIVQGTFNTMLAFDSIALGQYNRTSYGGCSATIGYSLVTPTNGSLSGNAFASNAFDTQFIVGRWNNFNINSYTQGHRFAVGNGTGDGARFTALNVLATSGTARVGIAQDIPAYVLDVTGTARLTGGYTTSDERLKENIQDNTLGLSELVQLRTVTFDWKTDENLLGRTMEDIPQNKNCKGLIAQEAEAVSSDLVETDDSEHEIKSINQGALTAMLIKAIQEQQDVIESLTERIQALENN